MLKLGAAGVLFKVGRSVQWAVVGLWCCVGVVVYLARNQSRRLRGGPKCASTC
ncbi:hypothetical protein K505DRAFT_163274 [Melanomma pulvis-pyrius CBS 109.77]|uniref:Uncharacterized protein n=1 Tax=Melanomma pulvis-pyrius CBS 109.77 TaxID=1314802 RepID=A0A6A6XJP8_9PLEO|nr:hypothetical protein K505DRAFT_163274 [Melanomma pulvis-pyrius CBS 109.77]